jgi:hypothetical protein
MPPQRKNVRLVDSSEVQGEDSWIKIRQPTVRETRQTVKPDLELEDIGVSFIQRVIVGWNWVDDDGNPLPQVKDDPGVLEDLTPSEMSFIEKTLTFDSKN